MELVFVSELVACSRRYLLVLELIVGELLVMELLVADDWGKNGEKLRRVTLTGTCTTVHKTACSHQYMFT